jgi:hypothetical protein
MITSCKAKQNTSKPSVHDEVVKLTLKYFDPETPHYISKLIKIHTNKSPEELSKAELMSLLSWIGCAISFLIEDQNIVEKYLADLADLARGICAED